MIIKKKYTILKSQQNEPDISGEVHQAHTNTAPADISVESQGKKQKTDEAAKQDNKQAENKESNSKPKEEKKFLEDFDFSLDNIKFEEREERREGSRRRGYRRTQDRNIISRAQEDAKSIKEQAKQDGYKEGIANSKKELEDLKSKFAEFYKYKDEIFDKVSDCIFDISVEIAKRILNKEIESDKTAVIKMIKNALEEVNKTENKIIIKVMPQDVEIVKKELPSILEGEGFEAAISVVPDKGITEGGVIVETSNGIIDASVQTQLLIIEKALCGDKEDKQ